MKSRLHSQHQAGGEEHLLQDAELLSVKAVARLLGGCSTRHIYRMADAGRMPRPVRLGTLTRWRRRELLAWLEAGCPPHDRWQQHQASGR